jgi:hypothetical protein
VDQASVRSEWQAVVDTIGDALRVREPVAFDVFSPNGEFLGPVKVPLSFRTEPEPVFRGDFLWAITRDELDVPWVVRFRIVTG